MCAQILANKCFVGESWRTPQLLLVHYNSRLGIINFILKSSFVASTLVYLMIVQDGINVQDGKIPKINKRAGWNKAVQVGIFQKLLLWKPILGENFQKLINVQDGIRVCRLDFFKKIISCAARLLDRLE